jgi:D-sedoheptulose 7-phosphate isomerase
MIVSEYSKLIDISLSSINKKLFNELKNAISKTYEKNNIFICGNGGSAANANHIANDLGHLRSKKYKHGFSAYSLVANESLFSCYANDYGYQNVFSKQLENHAKKNDLLIILSCSGNSENIINAAKTANKLKMNIFGVIGSKQCKIKKQVKRIIFTNINDIQVSEDFQTIIFHILAKQFNNE